MKRSGFKPKGWTPRPSKVIEYMPRARQTAVAMAVLQQVMVRSFPKESVLQHLGYIAIVQRMPCAHCGRPGPSQFCHADEDKGTGIKTDCRRGWPGCADRPGQIGCHTLVGSTGHYPKAERRKIEERMGRETRADVIRRGLWPANLPRWPEDTTASVEPALTL